MLEGASAAGPECLEPCALLLQDEKGNRPNGNTDAFKHTSAYDAQDALALPRQDNQTIIVSPKGGWREGGNRYLDEWGDSFD